jgi:AcrR family transcriptional regulator
MTATRLRLAPAERRQQIIDAARRLYADRPYEDVSTVELAAAAGVARGLINHYFGDKRELFLAVMRDSIVMPHDALPDLAGVPLEERARVTMAWIMDAATTYGQAWVNASGTADLRGDSDVQEIVDAADDRAARLVLDALGLEDSPVLRARLRAFAAMVKSTCREWLQRGTLSRDETLDILTTMLVLLVEKETS